MIYLLNTLLLVFIIWYVGRSQTEKVLYYSAFIIKILAGLSQGLIYHYYYESGDTLRYYDLASSFIAQSGFSLQDLVFAELSGFQNEPRAANFTRIVAAIKYVSSGDYWIVSCYLSVLSFLAFWYFYKQIVTTQPNIKWPIIIGFLFLPSVVFWSSGIMKGTLTNASIVLLSGISIKLFYRKKMNIGDYVLALLAIVLLVFIQYYTAIILLPVLVYIVVDKWALRSGINALSRFICYLLIFILTLSVGRLFNPNLKIERLPRAIQINQEHLEKKSEFQHTVLKSDGTWLTLIKNTPHALSIGLFAPNIFSGLNHWAWIPMIENSLMLILTFLSLFLLVRRKFFKPDILLVGTILYILVLATILAMAVPNYGALVRYKVAFTPFLVTIISILPYWEWIDHRRSKIKNG